jgi:pimeloyl-ACP methyl ester carboxylesterase
MQRHSLSGLSKNGFHTLSYVEWGRSDADHIVVCVHGLTRNARDFDVLAQSLLPACRVVCPDVVGRGESAWLPDKSDYGFPQYLADMNALLARITAHAPAQAVIDWVGTSMGGLIGMLLAALPGTPLRRLVMNDVGPFIPKAALERIGAYVGKAPHFASIEEAERYIRIVSASFGPLTDAQWRHLTEHNVQRGDDGRYALKYDPDIAAGFAGPIADVDLWSAWDRIGSPALVLRGVESDLLLPAIAEAMTRRGPKAQLVEFAGVGHAPMLMADDQVRVVHDFILA